MQTRNDEEKLYDLIEQFDFIQLSAIDRNFVLSQISESEYTKLRQTLSNIHNYYESYHLPELEFNIPNQNTQSKIVAFLKTPIQLYKAAAGLAIIIGTYALLNLSNHQNNHLAQIHDTVYLFKTDTIVKNIKEVIRVPYFSNSHISNNELITNKTKPSNHTLNCETELCPNDIEKIETLAFNNNLSGDSILKDFIVSIK